MRSTGLTILMTLALCYGGAVFGALQEPVRMARGVVSFGKTETVSRVSTAKVVTADYILLKKDFPQLRKLNHAEIDRWIIQNSAFISQAQAAQTESNSIIETTAETRIVYRPYNYGRRIGLFIKRYFARRF